MPARTAADGKRSAQVRPHDTAPEAYVRLRDLFVECFLQPGQRLAHAMLMQLLGIGRMPLRAALSRLESDGLVVATPNRGVVAPVPVACAEEIYTLRYLVDAAISFFADLEENRWPALRPAVTRANGLTIEADDDGAIPKPAHVRWSVPCRSMPALHTPYLVFEPDGA